MKAWVVQSTIGRGENPCSWWNGVQMDGDDGNAVRFARREDAQTIIDRLLFLDGTLSAEEHEWSDE